MPVVHSAVDYVRS